MKKVLIIGMVDSIHTYHWIERIIDDEIVVHIFSSRKHRRIHHELVNLLRTNEQIVLVGGFPLLRFSPYWSLARNLFLKAIGFNDSFLLRRHLKKTNYEFIHALEIQHAGYLLLAAFDLIPSATKTIATNWGSDIFYFSQFPKHRQKIQALMQKVDCYSAECERDYELAADLGFEGERMTIIPNSYSYTHPSEINQIASERNQVIGKCYGELFGLGSIILECAEKILRDNPQIQVFLYSVTKDLEKQASVLKKMHPFRLRYFTVREPLSHEALLREFAKSRVYMGASRSDGISTSFLEAMSQGAYPVQTNTSCASEWLQMGCVGSVVGTTKDEIYKALNLALKDDELVNTAQKENARVLSATTDFLVLSKAAKAFYS